MLSSVGRVLASPVVAVWRAGMTLMPRRTRAEEPLFAVGMEGMVGGPGFKSVEQHEREVAQIAAAVAGRNGRRVSCRKKPGESHCVRMSSYKVCRSLPACRGLLSNSVARPREP